MVMRRLHVGTAHGGSGLNLEGREYTNIFAETGSFSHQGENLVISR